MLLHKLICSWIKYNIDGTSRANLGLSTIQVIFRDSSDAIVGCFSNYLSVSTSFHVELYVAM